MKNTSVVGKRAVAPVRVSAESSIDATAVSPNEEVTTAVVVTATDLELLTGILMELRDIKLMFKLALES